MNPGALRTGFLISACVYCAFGCALPEAAMSAREEPSQQNSAEVRSSEKAAAPSITNEKITALLEAKWTPEKILDHIERYPAAPNVNAQGPKLDRDDLRGFLHKGFDWKLRVGYVAIIDNDRLDTFFVFASSEGRSWVIEVGQSKDLQMENSR